MGTPGTPTPASGPGPGAAFNPQPGDLACVPISGDLGRAIGLAEWLAERSTPGPTHYEHVFIFLGRIARPATVTGQQLGEHGWTEPGYYCAEAQPRGARLRLLGTTLAEVGALYGTQALWSTGRLTLTPEQRAKVVRYALGKLGTPYSFADYGSLALYHWHIRLPLVKDRIQDSGHMICSQYADWCWDMAGSRLFGGRFEGDVMPSDIAARIRRGDK